MILLGLLVVAAVGIAYVLPFRSLTPATGQLDENSFVPIGKARHIAITYTTVITGSPGTKDKNSLQGVPGDGTETLDYWLANGTDHLLMRQSNLSNSSSWQLLTDDAYYNYVPDTYRQEGNEYIGGNVYKYPYDPSYIPSFTSRYPSINILPDPQIMEKILAAIPNSRLVGDALLDGSNVALVEAIGTSDFPVEPGVSRPYDTSLDIRYWVDLSTHKIMQVWSVVTVTSGPQKGFQYGGVQKLSLDELVDRSILPADYFTFKLPPGTALVDLTSATPTPVSVPAIPTNGARP
jgi:hypothetical protein